MKRVLCDATVDRLGPKTFQVTLQGRGDHEGNVKVYTVNATTEDVAARDGIKRFVREMDGDA